MRFTDVAKSTTSTTTSYLWGSYSPDEMGYYDVEDFPLPPFSIATDGRKVQMFITDSTTLTLTYPEQYPILPTTVQYLASPFFELDMNYRESRQFTLPVEMTRHPGTNYPVVDPNDVHGLGYKLDIVDNMSPEDVSNMAKAVLPGYPIFETCTYTFTPSYPVTLKAATFLTATKDYIVRNGLTMVQPQLSQTTTRAFAAALLPTHAEPGNGANIRPPYLPTTEAPSPAIAPPSLPIRTAMPKENLAGTIPGISGGEEGDDVPAQPVVGAGAVPAASLVQLIRTIDGAGIAILTPDKASNAASRPGAAAIGPADASLPIVIGTATFAPTRTAQIVGPDGESMVAGSTVFVDGGSGRTAVVLTTNAAGSNVLVADGTSTIEVSATPGPLMIGGKTFRVTQGTALIGPGDRPFNMGQTIYAGEGISRTTMVLTTDARGSTILIGSGAQGTSTIKLPASKEDSMISAIMQGIGGAMRSGGASDLRAAPPNTTDPVRFTGAGNRIHGGVIGAAYTLLVLLCAVTIL
ncbi:Hypothetical protein D9617_1g082240 [Elsinoe fawcettii]|nr:Hypothetical protein D9617_1g082240 [Elsinoe fawcettii]